MTAGRAYRPAIVDLPDQSSCGILATFPFPVAAPQPIRRCECFGLHDLSVVHIAMPSELYSQQIYKNSLPVNVECMLEILYKVKLKAALETVGLVVIVHSPGLRVALGSVASHPVIDSANIRISFHAKLANESSGKDIPIMPWLLCPMPNIPLVQVPIGLVRGWFTVTAIWRRAVIVDVGVLVRDGGQRPFVDMASREVCLAIIGRLIIIIEFKLERLSHLVIWVQISALIIESGV
jgi:hypothetical protein